MTFSPFRWILEKEVGGFVPPAFLRSGGMAHVGQALLHSPISMTFITFRFCTRPQQDEGKAGTRELYQELHNALDKQCKHVASAHFISMSYPCSFSCLFTE